MTPDSDIRLREAIRRFALGEIVIVTDNEDRENEGDMICAAGLCTPEKMAFIIRHGCGIVCAPLTRERASALDLTPMVARNNAPLATAFTVSVDAKQGLTTGISATERCALWLPRVVPLQISCAPAMCSHSSPATEAC